MNPLRSLTSLTAEFTVCSERNHSPAIFFLIQENPSYFTITVIQFSSSNLWHSCNGIQIIEYYKCLRPLSWFFLSISSENKWTFLLMLTIISRFPVSVLHFLQYLQLRGPWTVSLSLHCILFFHLFRGMITTSAPPGTCWKITFLVIFCIYISKLEPPT